MSDKEKRNIEETVKILMQLDEQSLLLIDSGAKLLVARQNMEGVFRNAKLQKV